METTRDLPDPKLVSGPVAVDSETTGLYVDDGARLTVVSVAYRRKDDPGAIHHHAFPFDVGGAFAKGFTVVTFPDTAPRRKAGVAGLPKGDPHGRWTWSDGDTDPVNLGREEWYALRTWLYETGQLVGHVYQNAKFDLHFLRAGAPHGWPGTDFSEFCRWDTMLGSHVLWPTADGNSLKPTAARLWGPETVAEADELKEALAATKLRYGLLAAHGPRYDLAPWEVLGPYAAADAILTLRLYEHQVQAFSDGEAGWAEIERQMALMQTLYRIEIRGLGPIDVEEMERAADAIDQRVTEIVESDLPFDVTKPAKAREYFFDQLGLAPWKPGDEPREVAPDGKVVKAGSLTADIARRMAAAGVPYAAEYAEFLQLTIANRMFYRNYVDLAGDDRRLRTNFRQARVKTGRMSVERFQAQALPKHLGLEVGGVLLPEPRSLIGVEPGRVRVNLDLSQAELRLAAKWSGCDSMSQLLADGGDVHGATATAIFGVTPEDPDWKEKRDIAKRTVFGGIFMLGARGLQSTLMQLAGKELTLQECDLITKRFRATYPEFGHVYNTLEGWVKQNGYVELWDGTRSWFGPTDWPRTAWNRVVQAGLAKWVGGIWLPEIESQTRVYDALVLTVHDSCVLDLPAEIAESTAAKLADVTAEMWAESFGIPGRADVTTWE